MKTKLNWKKVWSEFNKLADAADTFWIDGWKEQKILFYAVVNKNLPYMRRLNNANVAHIERNFKNWFKREKFFTEWKYQRKELMKLVNNEI